MGVPNEVNDDRSQMTEELELAAGGGAYGWVSDVDLDRPRKEVGKELTLNRLVFLGRFQQALIEAIAPHIIGTQSCPLPTRLGPATKVQIPLPFSVLEYKYDAAS